MFKMMAPFQPAPPPSSHRREELHGAWVNFFENEYGAEGEIVHTREYLLVLGTRR
jgi:hypothetical protein